MKNKVSEENVIEKIREFYGDTSRTPRGTLKGLKSIREDLNELIGVLEEETA